MGDEHEHHDLVEVPHPPAPADEPQAAAEPVPAPPAEGVGGEAPEAELAELKDRYLRLAAEFDNFRKRVVREREDLRVRSQGELARRLLDALDDLGRVAHLDPAATTTGDVLAGIELVERKVLKELGAAGLEVVTASGVPFDPAIHEAIGTVPAATPEDDHTVGSVLQPGYCFAGVLLRPARVLVRIWATPAVAD
jgi:molecular chaperone GrpE